MTYRISFIITLIFAIGGMACQQSNPAYAFEQEVFECVELDAAENDIDLRAHLNQLEATLIAGGHLKDESGESYLSLLKSLEDDPFRILEDSLVLLALKDYPINFNCMDSNILDTAKIKQLVNFQYSISPLHFFMAQQLGEEPPAYATPIAMEEDWVKFQFYIGILGLSMYREQWERISDKGIKVQLPPWSGESSDVKIDSSHVLRIVIDGGDQIWLGRKRSPLDSVKSKVMAFLKGDGQLAHNPRTKYFDIEGVGMVKGCTKCIVFLNNQRGAGYKTYIGTYNAAKAAYDEIWDETAMKIYGKKYEFLEKDKRKRIRNIYPFVLSEAEPDDS